MKNHTVFLYYSKEPSWENIPYEWYRPLCVLFFGLLGFHLYYTQYKAYKFFQRELSALHHEQEYLLEQLDSYQNLQTEKEKALYTLVSSIQQGEKYTLEQLEEFENKITENEDTIHKLQENMKDLTKNTTEKHIWYDKSSDTYVYTTKLSSDIAIHEMFSFQHAEKRKSMYGGVYVGRFATTTRYFDEDNPTSLIRTTLDDYKYHGHMVSIFLKDWIEQKNK